MDHEDCSICMCNRPNCQLMCGHTFCRQCVKEWYVKTGDTATCGCPVCRRPMYFRNMHKHTRAWKREKHENMYDSAFEMCFDELWELAQMLMEEVPDMVDKSAIVQELGAVQKRLWTIPIDSCDGFDTDDLRDIAMEEYALCIDKEATLDDCPPFPPAHPPARRRRRRNAVWRIPNTVTASMSCLVWVFIFEDLV